MYNEVGTICGFVNALFCFPNKCIFLQMNVGLWIPKEREKKRDGEKEIIYCVQCNSPLSLLFTFNVYKGFLFFVILNKQTLYIV